MSDEFSATGEFRPRPQSGTPMHADAERAIADLGLEPHPEGGWYREIFRSAARVTTADGRTRAALTTIYYLITSGDGSAWHRLASDETWHFARGSDLVVRTRSQSGETADQRIGAYGPYVAIVPADTAFSAFVHDEDGYALVSCSVGPGFDFADFALLEG